MKEQKTEKTNIKKTQSEKSIFIKYSILAVLFSQLLTVALRAFTEYLPLFARSPIFSGRGYSFFTDNLILFLSLYFFYVFVKKYYFKAFGRLAQGELFKAYSLTFFVLAKALSITVEKLSENLCYLLLKMNTLSSLKKHPELENSEEYLQLIKSKALLTRFGYSFLSFIAAIVMLVTLFFLFYAVFGKTKKQVSNYFLSYTILSVVSLILTVGYNAVLKNVTTCVFDGITIVACGVFTGLFVKRAGSNMGMNSSDWKKQYPSVFLIIFFVALPFIHNIISNFT